MPRGSLLDPQGQAVGHALEALGFRGVADVRVGRALTFHLVIEGDHRDAAEQSVRRMCESLLANPVTEDFAISVHEAG
jgi:phosphoribosylformylglycinamidine synthase